MSFTIRIGEKADEAVDVDIARFTTNKDTLHIEFAKIISTDSESGEIEELEVCSSHRMPMVNAMGAFLNFFSALVEHEKEYMTGHGISLPDSGEQE